MAKRKYLLMKRGSVEPGNAAPKPSPAQMQDMYAAFNAWKEKFRDDIVDMGGRLSAGGKILTVSGPIDGPLVEAKEIVGGYMVVEADSYDRALEIAAGCPGLIQVGSSCEIREIMTA
jgi:hypothetical protein